MLHTGGIFSVSSDRQLIYCLNVSGHTGDPPAGGNTAWRPGSHSSSNVQDGPQNDPPSRNPGSLRCGVGTTHLGVYPLGFDDQEMRGVILTLLDSDGISESACLHQCCSLGPSKCQYLWFFETKCIAVSCSQSLPLYCRSVPAPPYIPPADTKYLGIQYNRWTSNWADGESISPPTVPTDRPPFVEETMSSLPNPNEPPEVGISPKDVVIQDSEVTLSAWLSGKQHQVCILTGYVFCYLIATILVD